jgi:hypothetical protein
MRVRTLNLLDLVDDEVGRQQARITTENVLNHFDQHQHLWQVTRIQAVRKRLGLFTTRFHDFAHAFIVHAADDLPDGLEAQDPKVGIGVDQFVLKFKRFWSISRHSIPSFYILTRDKICSHNNRAGMMLVLTSFNSVSIITFIIRFV